MTKNSVEIGIKPHSKLLVFCNTICINKLQLAFVGTDSMPAGVDILQSPFNNSQSMLLQQAGVAFTLSDQGQQVFVITDPAQLEALQVGEFYQYY